MKDFTVTYWDQRGTGLSSSSLRRNNVEISAVRIVDDAVSILELLHDRFGGRIFVAGFSFGATFAAQAAVRRPDLVAALIATGMDIDIPFAETYTYNYVLDEARKRGNRWATRQLEKIGPPPHLHPKRFATRARWAANFGGVTANTTFSTVLRSLIGSLLRSRAYSIAATIRTVRGITSSQTSLLPELAETDLVRTMPSLEVPIVLAQGRHDQVAPAEPAQRFYDTLTAPSKQLVWFEKVGTHPPVRRAGKVPRPTPDRPDRPPGHHLTEPSPQAASNRSGKSCLS